MKMILHEATLGDGAMGGALTLVFFLSFIAWVWWAWSPSRRESIETWSRIPFDGGEP